MAQCIPIKDKTYTKLELLRLADGLALLYLHRYDIPQYSGLLQSTSRHAVNLRLNAAEISNYDTIPSDIAGLALNDAKIALDSKCREVAVLNELQLDTADEIER